MAAQVLSGSGNITYTNTTGQNVRIVVNLIRVGNSNTDMSFQGVNVVIPFNTSVGKTVISNDNRGQNIPFEFAISNGETFSLINSTSSDKIEAYNFVIIPEAG